MAEAIHTYDKQLGPLRVLPVYGGQSMQQQIKRLPNSAALREPDAPGHDPRMEICRRRPPR